MHGSIFCFVLNSPEIIYWTLYEFCSKIPGRSHPLPADVDIPMVRKDVLLGWGINHLVPSNRGVRHCWMAVYLWVIWKCIWKGPASGQERDGSWSGSPLNVPQLPLRVGICGLCCWPTLITSWPVFSSALPPAATTWSLLPMKATLSMQQTGMLGDYHLPWSPLANGSRQLIYNPPSTFTP